MITFFGTGPMFGLPQASPFAFKTEVLLLMSGLSFTQARADMRSASLGKSRGSQTTARSSLTVG